MERLTTKHSANYGLIATDDEYCDVYCAKQRKETCRECGIHQAIQKLAAYEDAEEQGLLTKVVHGKWYQIKPLDEDDNAIFECTNCHHGDVQAKGTVVPYCWYCGAKMNYVTEQALKEGAV